VVDQALGSLNGAKLDDHELIAEINTDE